jgi:hypothetical protein
MLRRRPSTVRLPAAKSSTSALRSSICWLRSSHFGDPRFGERRDPPWRQRRAIGNQRRDHSDLRGMGDHRGEIPMDKRLAAGEMHKAHRVAFEDVAGEFRFGEGDGVVRFLGQLVAGKAAKAAARVASVGDREVADPRGRRSRRRLAPFSKSADALLRCWLFEPPSITSAGQTGRLCDAQKRCQEYRVRADGMKPTPRAGTQMRRL